MQERIGIQMSTRDYEGFRNDMIEQLKVKIPEYTDFSQSDVGIVLIELLAHGLDILSYYNDKVANELFLDTAQERNSVLRLADMLGYKVANSTPSKFMQVFEVNTSEEPTIIPKGYVVRTKDDFNLEQSLSFELDEDLIIPPNMRGTEKDAEGNYLYTIPITQGYTVTDEVLGTSTGNPDQVFKLFYNPVIYDSLKLKVKDALDFEEWERVDNFLNSISTSKHYTLNILEDGYAFIRFGNGISGAIPKVYDSGIVATYRVGGGSEGNVSPKTITDIPQRLSGIVDTFNPLEAYEKGRDSESIDEIRVKAPANLSIGYGIVTLDDFKNFILSEDTILRANAVYIESTRPLIQIYYYAKGTIDKEVLEQNILDSYNSRKLVGTTLLLSEGRERKMNVNIEIKLLPYADTVKVDKAVRDYIESIIFTGSYDFAEHPETSDIIAELTFIEGVRAVKVYFDNVDDLQADELVTLGNLVIDYF